MIFHYILNISVFRGMPDRGAFNMFENMFKNVKICKKLENDQCPIKKVDKAICPINEKDRSEDLRAGCFSICRDETC